MPKKLTCTCPVHKPLRFVQISHSNWEDDRGRMRSTTFGLTADGVLYRFDPGKSVWVLCPQDRRDGVASCLTPF